MIRQIILCAFLVSCAHLSGEPNRELASEMDCNTVMHSFIHQDRYALIPNALREDAMSGEYRKILIKWKADSPVARRESEALATRQLQELGMKSNSFIIDIDNLPDSSIFSEMALKNPKIKFYIQELQNAGYSLVIDPHMAIASDNQVVRGMFSPSRNSIRILPHTSWEVFLHEYQHFLFFKLGFRNPGYVLGTSNLADKKADKILEVAKKLYKKGYSQTTVDETLAVSEEINTLYRLGYTPWSNPVYEARKYAWSFQLQDRSEGLEANIIRAKMILLNPYFIRSAFIGSAMTYYFYNKESDEVISISPQEAGDKNMDVHILSLKPVSRNDK